MFTTIRSPIPIMLHFPGFEVTRSKRSAFPGDGRFDRVTMCLSMLLDLLVTMLQSARELSESNMIMRDLAEIHVLTPITPAAGGRQYIPVAPEIFTHQKAAEIIEKESSALASRVARGEQEVILHVGVDGRSIERGFPNMRCTSFDQTVINVRNQIRSSA